jgi:glyoxylase-like metal-dependent hydrolase (beta-lactamase superfamily II)
MRRRWLKRTLLLLVGALLVAVALLAYTFMPRTLDVEAYRAETTTFHMDERPRELLPEVSLSLIKCGVMTSLQSFVYRGASWGEHYESGMAAVLVRHPRATFLFDGGFGRNLDEHIKIIPWLMRRMTTVDKERPAAAQLEEGGVTADQIKMILLSHFHWDHISGAEDFPQSEVWLLKEEADFIPTLPEDELARQMSPRLRFRPLELTDRPYENFDRSLDLFEDGSVVLVALPGHTPGSMGMFVNLRSGKRFFFTGDLTWALEGVELPAERPWISRRLVDLDEEKVRLSIVRTHQLSKRYPDMIIVPAHDRRVHNRIAIFPQSEH